MSTSLKLNILGCGSATPTLRHQPSCQVVEHNQRLFMIDCGEGAQLQMMRQRLKFGRMNHVFLSHLHGDHFLGLPGLLSTMALHHKGAAVTVHTFSEGVEQISRLMKFVCGDTPFDLKFNVLSNKHCGILWEDDSLTIECFPLYHRVPAVGYIFREKPKPRHINGEMARFYGVPNYRMNALRQGEDFETADGRTIPNALLTTDAEPARSYAYCSDTMFDPRVAEAVAGVSTLYHEATYGDDYAELAAPRGHSTARQAGRIAAMAGVETLILGHFSKRYNSEEQFVREAQEEFSGSVIAADEGLKIEL